MVVCAVERPSLGAWIEHAIERREREGKTVVALSA